MNSPKVITVILLVAVVFFVWINGQAVTAFHGNPAIVCTGLFSVVFFFWVSLTLAARWGRQ